MSEEIKEERVEWTPVKYPQRLVMLSEASKIPVEELDKMRSEDIQHLISLYLKPTLIRFPAVRKPEWLEEAKSEETGGTPTASQLQMAIDRAKAYINRMYEINGVYDYVKEYPAIALNVYVRNNAKWHWLGWYGNDRGTSYSKFHYVSIASTYELMDVGFEDLDREAGETPDYDYNEPYLWADRFYTDVYPEITKYQISFRYYEGTYRADVWLGTWCLFANVGSDTPAQTKEKTTTTAYQPANRYTARHGFQLCEKIYAVWGDNWSGSYLRALLSAFGFTYDIYDPIFKKSVGEANDYMYSGQCYRDVDVWGQLPRIGTNPNAYPYWSKVGINKYAWQVFTRSDELVRTLQAIHILNKYNNPDYEYLDPMCGYYPTYPTTYTSPRKEARHDENIWNGYGIPYPLKHPTYASGVRTNVFLVLESILGWKYNDATSRGYADLCADIVVSTQCGVKFETAEYGVITRPPHRGGHLLAWKQGASYPYAKAPKTPVLDDIIDMFAMPSEDDGVIATNLESTATALQAMRVYLYYKYGVAYPNATNIP